MNLVIYGARQLGIKTRSERHFGNLWFFGNIVWGITRGGAYLSEEPSSFRLPLTSLCDLPLLFVYFQVNNGVLYFLDYVEDIYIMVLSVLVSM